MGYDGGERWPSSWDALEFRDYHVHGDKIVVDEGGRLLGSIRGDSTGKTAIVLLRTGEGRRPLVVDLPVYNGLDRIADEVRAIRNGDGGKSAALDRQAELLAQDSEASRDTFDRYAGREFAVADELPDELRGTAFGRSRVRPSHTDKHDDLRRALNRADVDNDAYMAIMNDAKSADSTNHMPVGDKWAFDEGVTGVFGDMLERSIPQYRDMRALVLDLGSRFVQPKTAIVDLGCSNGLALDPFTERFGAHNRYIGVEVSEPMATEATTRFANWPPGVVRIYQNDLRGFYPVDQASLTLAVLTLMFVPINYRNRILHDAYENTVPGGALIVVEKLLGAYPETDELFVDRYHQMKRDNGYSLEAIERKRLALEGVQVPITDDANLASLRHAGFAVVECFWRWCNFAGYLAIKR